MEKKSKALMIEEIGMKFDEAIELFSDETLESMTMVNIVGGDTQTYCSGAQCISGCNSFCNGCGGSGNSGGSVTGGGSGNSGGSIIGGGGSSGGSGGSSGGSGGGITIEPHVYFTVWCGTQVYCGNGRT